MSDSTEKRYTYTCLTVTMIDLPLKNIFVETATMFQICEAIFFLASLVSTYEKGERAVHGTEVIKIK